MSLVISTEWTRASRKNYYCSPPISQVLAIIRSQITSILTRYYEIAKGWVMSFKWAKRSKRWHKLMKSHLLAKHQIKQINQLGKYRNPLKKLRNLFMRRTNPTDQRSNRSRHKILSLPKDQMREKKNDSDKIKDKFYRTIG